MSGRPEDAGGSARAFVSGRALRRLGRHPLAVWPPLLLWMALIFFFSNQPDIPQISTSMLDFLIKKSLHATAYAILVGLWWRALARTGLRHPLRWALVLSLLYAASDEWHQTFVPGRSGQATDVLIDGMGAGAMALCLRRWGVAR